MKQKKKYYTLLFLAIVLNFIYMMDRNLIVETIDGYQSDIRTIDEKLQTGSDIMDEVNTIRKNVIHNVEKLEAYSISGSELIAGIRELKTLARDLDIVIKDLEIDPRNTFPSSYKNLAKDQLQLDRQTLNLNLFGDFLDIGDFIETVQQNNAPFVLNECSIFLDSLDPKGVIARLQYVTYIGEES